MSLFNLARVVSATAGTGTLTLGAAVSGCLTFADAGVPDGAKVSYGISDGVNSEVGRGTYTSAGTTLSRDTVLASTNSGNKINCSGNEQVFITALAEDIIPIGRWISAFQTWTYASANSFTVTGDITDTLWVGEPVRWKQGGAYKYAHIISFSYSSPNTTVVIACGSDYSIANAAITDNDYGLNSNPVGFPAAFNLTAPTFTASGTAFANQPATSLWIMYIIDRLAYVRGLIINHAASNATGDFTATFAAGQLPPTYTYALGDAANYTTKKSGACWVTESNDVINMALYDGSALAGNSETYLITLIYLLG